MITGKRQNCKCNVKRQHKNKYGYIILYQIGSLLRVEETDCSLANLDKGFQPLMPNKQCVFTNINAIFP